MRPVVSREPNHVTLMCSPMSIEGFDKSDINVDWFEFDYWQQKQCITGSADGRGTTHFIHHNGFDLVLRRYCRGGLIRHLSKDKFIFAGLQNTRPWREITLHSYMLNKGLPVPFTVAGKITRIGPWYTADLLSLRIPGARDLHQHLLQGDIDDKDWTQVGRTIAQLHDAQVYHHDLNIHNIMMDENHKIWVIDFDKCGVQEGNKWKSLNLDRLLRSLRKEANKHPEYHFTDHNWQMLLAGYSAK